MIVDLKKRMPFANLYLYYISRQSGLHSTSSEQQLDEATI